MVNPEEIEQLRGLAASVDGGKDSESLAAENRGGPCADGGAYWRHLETESAVFCKPGIRGHIYGRSRQGKGAFSTGKPVSYLASRTGCSSVKRFNGSWKIMCFSF